MAMPNLNRVFMTGTLGKAPELRSSKNGQSICWFSICQNSFSKKVDGEYEKTAQWFQVCAYEKIADQCIERLEKGSQVLIEGELKHTSYEKDGQKIHKIEIVAKKVGMLGQSSKGSNYKSKGMGSNSYIQPPDSTRKIHNASSVDPYYGQHEELKINEDDIPF